MSSPKLRSATPHQDASPTYVSILFLVALMSPHAKTTASFSGRLKSLSTRDHIVPSLNAEGVRVERTDEIFSTDVPIEHIWVGIVGATFIVADLTTKSPTVLYQVGMAHTVGKPMVIITQALNDVPFGQRRCILYRHTPDGCSELARRLGVTARFFLSRIERRPGG